MFRSDAKTLDSLKELWGLRDRSGKPLLLWIGAGAGAWIGYPLWHELAHRFHRTFVRASSAYNKVRGREYIDKGDYPALFQLCRDSDHHRYLSLLADSFSPQPATPVFERLIRALDSLRPLAVVTTNVDDSLERAIPDATVLQRSDFPRAIGLLQCASCFIVKLHGSISSMATSVFTTEDYAALCQDDTYLATLTHLCTSCSVIFLGYGARDKYLIDLLQSNSRVYSMFGDGPHFLISSEDRTDLPDSVRLIRYLNHFHQDHRSSLLAVEILRRPQKETESITRAIQSRQASLKSSSLISDLYPGGTWTTGTIATTKSESSDTRLEIFGGPDWSPEEMGPSTAAYDLAVALLCFDTVYLPVDCVSRVFQLVGEDVFRRILTSDCLEFIHWEGYDGIAVNSLNRGHGYFVCAQIPQRDAGFLLNQQLKAVPGQEYHAALLVADIERRVQTIDLRSMNFQDVCAGLFISPPMREVLGISDATPAGHIPRWLAHPALRVAQVARIGATCQALNIASMSLMPGAAPAAEIAFGAVAGGLLASEIASYVLSGQMEPIPETVFASHPGVWASILQFRDSGAGANVRAGVLRQLAENSGAEIVAAIDAGLRQTVPTTLTNIARREMSALLLANKVPNMTPAVWSSASFLHTGPALWRRRSKMRLMAFLKETGTGLDYDCPCGSGDKVKFCCYAALED